MKQLANCVVKEMLLLHTGNSARREEGGREEGGAYVIVQHFFSTPDEVELRKRLPRSPLARWKPCVTVLLESRGKKYGNDRHDSTPSTCPRWLCGSLGSGPWTAYCCFGCNKLEKMRPELMWMSKRCY